MAEQEKEDSVGLGKIVSSVIDAGVNIWATNKNNKSAKHAAEMQRGWEEYMSNTAHQREVEDLIKAGINPILTATGGNGASTPSGATAQVTPYNPLSIMSAALQMEKSVKESEGIQAGIDKTEAETAGINLENAKNEKLNPKIIDQAQKNLEQTIAETAKKNAEKAKIEEETKQIRQGVGGKILGTDPGKIVEDAADKIKKQSKKKSAKDVMNSNAWMGYPGLF